MSSVSGMRLAVVMPTRNRGDLAIRAIQSVTPQLPAGSLVLVSDNSTASDHIQRLRRYVNALDRHDVLYRRPPGDLAMSDHWEWAMDNALSMPAITHCTVLTDRMIFKRSAISRLAATVATFSDDVISYSHDVVDDYSRPVRLHCQAWTGRTICVRSERLLRMSAAMEHHPALPRMLNCVTPVTHLQRLKAAFGTAFDSVAPDMCFAFRTLSQIDHIRYIDEALLVHGALARSNGASYARGELSPDHADFVAKLNGLSLNHAAPVPEFQTVGNTVVSEYELVRQQTGLPRFMPIDLDTYFAKVEIELAQIKDPSLSARMYSLLEQSRHPSSTPPPAARSLLRRLPTRSPTRLLVRAVEAAISSPPTTPLWKRLHAAPPQTRWLRFPHPEEAFEFAQSPGRRRSRTHTGLEALNS